MKEAMFMNPVPRTEPVGEEVRDDESVGSGIRKLPDSYWYDIASRIAERSGDAVTPIGLRAHALIRALGIPSGQCSPLEFSPDGTRDIARERLFSERVVAPAGAETAREGIPSSGVDVLSLAEDVELLTTMDERSAAIIEADRRQKEADVSAYSPMLYFRLPGGVDLFVKGVTHEPSERLDPFVGEILESAGVVSIEGIADLPYGSSIRKMAMCGSGQDDRFHGYEHFVGDAIEKKRDILFVEVDPRDESRVSFDTARTFSDLPDGFFGAYFRFLTEQDPGLAERIGGADAFRELLRRQTGSNLGKVEEASDERRYHAHAFVEPDGVGGFRSSATPTGFELGQLIFSDAVSAIRLHLLARLMADGKLPKGPMVDFQGSDHLSGKQFFLRYPEYAMEVALRAMPEILASEARGFFRKTKIESVSKGLTDPDWSKIAKKIGTVATMRSTFRWEPTVVFVDAFREYGIDVADIMPSDEDIERLVVRAAEVHPKTQTSVIAA